MDKHGFKMAYLQWNSRIGKVFELAERRFCHDMERDLYIRAIFPYHDRNLHHDGIRILNPWCQGTSTQEETIHIDKRLPMKPNKIERRKSLLYPRIS